MLAGARRSKKPGEAARRVVAASPASSGPQGGPAELRLALARGRLGIELGTALSWGPLELTELSYILSDVRFPVDLSGGVARFRHVRGQLASVRVDLPLVAAARSFERRAQELFRHGPARLVIAPTLDGALVGVADDQSALAFDLVVAPLENGLRLIVERARGITLQGTAHGLACRVTEHLLQGAAERRGSVFWLKDPIGALLRAVLPDAGGRVPSTRGVRLYVDTSDDQKRARLVVRGQLEGELAPISARVVRALETAQLLEAADDRAVRGDDDARVEYLHALERAPRHPEAALRLASLDLAAGDRAEAAMSTVLDVMGLTEAGLLGCEILGALGEDQAAYTAAARAAAEEPFGILSARAWLRAAVLAPDREAHSAAVEEAIARAPMLSAARWERLVSCLGRGDVRGALAEAEHLEAVAPDRDARCDNARRAAEALLERGFVREAERWFERALRYEPRGVRALAGLARALRERGKVDRALDLFARAVALSNGEDHSVTLELARSLADFAGDLPNAVARVADIPQDALLAPEARVLEAEWRLSLGDAAGASRALGRLRAIAEFTRAETAASRATLVDALVRAAELDKGALGDLAAARADLAAALKVAPRHKVATRLLAGLVQPLPAAGTAARVPSAESSETVRPESEPAHEPAAQPAGGDTHAPEAHAASAAHELEDEGELEVRVDQLTSRIRSDPRDAVAFTELAELLDRLGRDLELLALLSARIEDADASDSAPLLARRRAVLLRLAARARSEGRASEASLYESMAEA